VLQMTVSHPEKSFTTWLAVVQAKGGARPAYKYVWKGQNGPTLFAHRNWYAREVSGPPDQALPDLLKKNRSLFGEMMNARPVIHTRPENSGSTPDK
jgi:hypothetical protein